MDKTEKRDGFAIRDFEGNEVHFVPCTRGGSQRERVLSGLLNKTREDLIVCDTRDEVDEDA